MLKWAEVTKVVILPKWSPSTSTRTFVAVEIVSDKHLHHLYKHISKIVPEPGNEIF